MFTSARRHRAAVVFGSAAVLVAGLATTIPAAGAHGGTPAVAANAKHTKKPVIKHVWEITLENESYNYSFGAKGHKLAPYLSKKLPAQGALLTKYYGIGHDSLDNYTAMVSGQNGNYQLNEDCKRFAPFVQFDGENYDKWTKYRQLSGDGCVYPKYVKTIGNQMTKANKSWRGYYQDMGNLPARDKTVSTSNGPACGHPAVGAIDLTDTTGPAKDSYATRHNGFAYFKSIIKNSALCDSHIVSLKPLKHDLKSIKTTPNLSYVTPNTCADAHDTPKCQDGTKGGITRANQFLHKWVPRIEKSAAYKKNGAILITFDEASHDEDAAACCGEVSGLGFDDPSHPNLNEPGLYGPGGGRVGAVMLSKFIKPGTVSNQPYNHFSQLKSFEDMFGLSHLGDAQQPEVHSFGPDVFTRP